MSTNAMNRNALDSRLAESLAGLEKSRLARDEQVFLVQYKNNWYMPYTPRAPHSWRTDHFYRVHRVQAVIFLTGSGLQSNSYPVRSCSSRGKAALHGATYKHQSPFKGYEVKND